MAAILPSFDPDVGRALIGADQPWHCARMRSMVVLLLDSLVSARRDRRSTSAGSARMSAAEPACHQCLTAADRFGPPPKARGRPSDRRAGSSSPVRELGQEIIKPVQEHWGESERGFIKQEHTGSRDKPTRDRQHLLLTAGKQASPLMSSRPQLREPIEQLLRVWTSISRGPRIGTKPQVVDHAQLGKDLAALRHENQPRRAMRLAV